MKKENKEYSKTLNPFKLINQVDELPPKLKEEVLATINYTQLVAHVGKLFTVDVVRAAGKMIDINLKEKKRIK